MSKALWIRYMKFVFLFVAMTLSVTVKAEIRKIVLSGIVKSTDKNPVDFATVYLKNTNFKCTTNEKGEYSLSAPAGEYTLAVSAIVFTTDYYSIFYR